MTPEIGEKFDANRHQAMFEASIPNATPGTIIEVMQEGFVIADRLLRPAMVGIAKAPPEPEPEEDAAEPAEGDELKWFMIAGAEQRWARAQARITGEDTIEVWAEEILDPVAVRYAWQINPYRVNFFNKEGDCNLYILGIT